MPRPTRARTLDLVEEAVFAALANPIRRRMMIRLGEVHQTSAGLARELEMSWSSAAKHLKVLEGAGLVMFDDLEEHRYSLDRDQLKVVEAWLKKIEDTFDF